MNNLEEILDDVVINGFPEFMDEDIWIEYKSIKKSLLKSGELTDEGFYIEVDNLLKDTSANVIMGGVAHELAHLVTERNLSKYSSKKDGLHYKRSKRYKTLDERDTDLRAILRGYGPHLLEFMKYSKEKGFPYYKKDGLSINEIKTLLKIKPHKNLFSPFILLYRKLRTKNKSFII
ncbi:hypothetical protein JW949_03870 [Candidatus Woesearchaeota archaeon]|nr:hypothetical protein [Candidatus Woesearchaeota archaeon]